jgi:hypothetical protein
MMKSNAALGFAKLVQVGEYTIGKKGDIYRAAGHEWHSEQDASQEFAHHDVCGRGTTADEAIDRMIEMAIISGRKYEGGCSGLDSDEAETLRRQLKEEIAELDDEDE